MKCVDCGFLARRLLKGEVTTEDRQALNGNIVWDEVDPRCFKSLWPDSTPEFEIAEQVNKERNCEGFFPYHPGYSPLEHRALVEKKQEKKHDLREKIVIAIIAGVAGSLLTLLTGWLRKRLGF